MSPLRILGVRVFTLLLAVPHAIMAQASGSPQPPTRAAIVGGVGFTIMHLPAFTYTRGSARQPAVEPAQEGGGPALAVGLEVLRGRLIAGGRYQFVVEPLTDNWAAHVVAVYAGVARRRPRSQLSVAMGPTLVHREQVTRQFAANACFYSGCLDDTRVNRDGGTLTTVGLVATGSAERRLGRHVGIGLEGFAAIGRQRYAGLQARLSLGSR